jgi:pimeloyl-ACP methyl ester carboxylesterase
MIYHIEILNFIKNELLLINNLNYTNFKNNSIILKNNNAIDDILIIHGGNSSPINWMFVGLEFYKNNYNIYLYSIPGFSSPIDINILNSNTDTIINYYNENIKNFIIENNIKPHLIGHSFGGFLAINFSFKYPNMVKTLIPINSLGILNIDNNNILILLFKNIHYIIKKLYLLIIFISFLLLKIFKKNYLLKETYIKLLKKIYNIINISRPDYYGTDIMNKFITFESLTKVYWNNILYLDMMIKKLPPITFIWSKNDKILSYNIPIIFINLLKKNNLKHPKLLLLKNNNHGFKMKDTKLLYNNIINAIKISKKIE